MKSFLCFAISVVFFCASRGFSQEPVKGLVQLTLPGANASLELNVGSAPFQQRIRPDGKEAQMRASNKETGLNISAFLQPVTYSATSKACRDDWWGGLKKQSQFDMQQIKLSEADTMAKVEYIVPQFQKVVDWRNVHAYLGVSNVCAEVHLSKTNYRPDDDKLFEVVLNSIRLTPKFALDTASWTAFNEGSRYYLQRDYPQAAHYYQTALDQEKQRRTFDKKYFEVLVDNLAMSYGISGNLNKAKETLEYGISQDSSYPLFYYNMACTYGEMGRMDPALEQLGKAYQYRANMIPGEAMPDPMQDSSLRNFVENKKFADAVREMQAQK